MLLWNLQEVFIANTANSLQISIPICSIIFQDIHPLNNKIICWFETYHFHFGLKDCTTCILHFMIIRHVEKTPLPNSRILFWHELFRNQAQELFCENFLPILNPGIFGTSLFEHWCIFMHIDASKSANA